jgi:hypothetical protein
MSKPAADTRRSDAQWRRAHRAIDRAIDNIDSEIGKLYDKVSRLDWVAPDAVRELLLVRLTDLLLKRMVDRAIQPGDETLKLGNALADYRDTQWHLR